MKIYFEVQNDWESRRMKWGGTEILSYPLVELSIDGNIFFVDAKIEIEEGEPPIANRYILGSVIDTLRFINQKFIKDSKITLLSTRRDNEGDYGISDLVEIIEAKDKADHITYILCCKNGRTYIDSALANSKDELTDYKTIYQKSLTKE